MERKAKQETDEQTPEQKSRMEVPLPVEQPRIMAGNVEQTQMMENNQTFENLNQYIQPTDQDVRSDDTPKHVRNGNEHFSSIGQSPNFYDPNKIKLSNENFNN